MAAVPIRFGRLGLSGNSRMLVAVSSPWASEKFVTPIRDLAQRLDAAVVVAHVAQQREDDTDSEDVKQRAAQTLELLAESLRESGVEADGVTLISNDVAKAILSTAKARSCSLVVMGLSGRGRLKRLIAGDVPADVLRLTDIPVLLYPGSTPPLV